MGQYFPVWPDQGRFKQFIIWLKGLYTAYDEMVRMAKLWQRKNLSECLNSFLDQQESKANPGLLHGAEMWEIACSQAMRETTQASEKNLVSNPKNPLERTSASR